MRDIVITFFNNKTDVCINEVQIMSWSELVEMFSEHLILEDKNDVMFSLIMFEKFTDQSLPYDENRTDKRCSENVVHYEALVLDYDGNGATIANMIQRFDGFKYLGYTSYRHILNDEHCEKFRLIFPFSTPCPKNEWDVRKEAFLQFAGPEVDVSCVSHSRSFHLPSCSEDGAKYKDHWAVDGVELDWEIFTPTPKVVPTVVQKPVSVSDMQLALDELRKYRPILPNEDRYALVRAVARHVGEQQAIIECRSRWPDDAYNGKYETMVKKLKPHGPSMGSIIHEIRKFNPSYNAHQKEASIQSIIRMGGV